KSASPIHFHFTHHFSSYIYSHGILFPTTTEEIQTFINLVFEFLTQAKSSSIASLIHAISPSESSTINNIPSSSSSMTSSSDSEQVAVYMADHKPSNARAPSVCSLNG
ncbi:unnamed protein product, partial [Dovyalis caffra]